MFFEKPKGNDNSVPKWKEPNPAYANNQGKRLDDMHQHDTAMASESESAERWMDEQLVSIDDGVTTTGLDKLTAELLPKLKSRSEDVKLAIHNIKNPEKQKELSKRIWQAVERIFENVPESDSLMQWNKNELGNGRYAHVAAYLLQDFRNSSEAKQLQQHYLGLDRDGRLALDTKLREEIGDTFVYEFMFYSPMKPHMFPPLGNPKYTQASVEGGTALQDEMGNRLMYLSKDDDAAFPDYKRGEGMRFQMRDRTSNMIFDGGYYRNNQPVYYFRFHDDNGKEIRHVSFKPYLGGKGELFFSNERIADREEPNNQSFHNLTLEQTIALHDFFRWERGEEGDQVNSKKEIYLQSMGYIRKINAISEKMSFTYPKSGDVLNNNEDIRNVLSEIGVYLRSLERDSQRNDVIQQLKSGYFRDKTGNTYGLVVDKELHLSFKVLRRR